MPIPRGLVDIRAHPASTEDRQRYEDAMRSRDFRNLRQFQDRIDFVFEDGKVARLPVSRSVFVEFLQTMQDIRKKSEAELPEPILVPLVPKLPPTVWERILEIDY